MVLVWTGMYMIIRINEHCASNWWSKVSKDDGDDEDLYDENDNVDDDDGDDDDDEKEEEEEEEEYVWRWWSISQQTRVPKVP